LLGEGICKGFGHADADDIVSNETAGACMSLESERPRIAIHAAITFHRERRVSRSVPKGCSESASNSRQKQLWTATNRHDKSFE